MKSRKLGTLFLSMLLVFTLLIAVGCGKDEDEKKENKAVIVGKRKPILDFEGNEKRIEKYTLEFDRLVEKFRCE